MLAKKQISFNHSFFGTSHLFFIELVLIFKVIFLETVSVYNLLLQEVYKLGKVALDLRVPIFDFFEIHLIHRIANCAVSVLYFN